MFYEESAINQILLCKVCDSKLNDPRLLPCGQSVCGECVAKLADTSNQRIKCLNCFKNEPIKTRDQSNIKWFSLYFSHINIFLITSSSVKFILNK